MTAMAKRAPRSELHRKQRIKNLAVVAALLGMVVLIYLITIVRIGGA